jgi:putative hydrolase of the HAD superfamily
VDAVLLDAYGTLVELRAPVPRLRGLLGDAGHHHPEERVARALAAEIRHYRRNHDRGRDAASLAALRRECAGVLARELGPDVPPPARLTEMLVESLRFDLIPDARPGIEALAARGLRLGVVSNWDCSLASVLEELGVRERFGAVSVSALAGAPKPHPAIFREALARLGVPAARALHCGDHPDHDCAGARAAGIRAVLIDRAARLPDGPCPRIGALTELENMIGR